MAGYRFSRWVQPSLILSGDFIDYFPLQDRYLACFLADVAGHGASSALLTVMLKNISWRLQQKFGLPSFNLPGDLLAWINETLIGQSIEKHVAMFLGIIDTHDDTLHYSMAAQYPPALLCKPDGNTQLLQQQAKPLGLFSDASYTSEQLPFPEGATLMVFSDGVMDCLPSSQFADKEAALVEMTQSLRDPLKIWSRLCESLKNLDDVSLLAVQRERSRNIRAVLGLVRESALQGSICAGDFQGTHVLRFHGDVRSIMRVTGRLLRSHGSGSCFSRGGHRLAVD